MMKLSNVVWDTKRGILGYVARTGEAIMIERMSLHPHYNAEVDILAHDCGLLCLPICSPTNEVRSQHTNCDLSCSFIDIGVIQLSVYGEPAFNNHHREMVLEYLKFASCEILKSQQHEAQFQVH